MTKLIAALAIGFSVSMAAQHAVATGSATAGRLQCTVANVESHLFEKVIELDCVFTDVNGENQKEYKGSIDRRGVSIGDISSNSFTWIVATVGLKDEISLAGTYYGAEAGASVSKGATADYLTGGFNKTIQLQPYAAEGSSGFGLTLGGQQLVLKEK